MEANDDVTIVTGIDPGIRNTGVCQYDLSTGRVIRVGLYDMAEGFEEREDRSLSKIDHVIRRVRELALARAIFREADEIRIEYQFEGLYSIAIHATFVATLLGIGKRVRTIFKESVHAQFRHIFTRGAGNGAHKTSATRYGPDYLCSADLALMARVGHAHHCYDALFFCLYDPSKKASAKRSAPRKRRAAARASDSDTPARAPKRKKAQSRKKKSSAASRSIAAKPKKGKRADTLRQTSLLETTTTTATAAAAAHRPRRAATRGRIGDVVVLE